MRKALVVGIDRYEHLPPLYGCVSDAKKVAETLEFNGDADLSKNFDVELWTTGPGGPPITRTEIKDRVRELFDDDMDIALFYFAGHGHIESTGGYLCGSECRTGDDGLPLAELVSFAMDSDARNKVIILDSCHSGVVATSALAPKVAELKEGTTILTASTAKQYATEENGSGVFTSLLIDALDGAAANLVGHVTPGSVYAHIDQSLGWWGQRPVFKTNVKSFVSLRRVQPPISPADMRKITTLFPRPGHDFPLEPAYEPESQAPDPEKNAVFAVLQKYNRHGLLVPVDAPHMWHAAMESKSCRLTILGEHYRRLVENKRI